MADERFEEQNVVAAFPDREKAEQAAAAARRAGADPGETRVDSKGDRVTSARAEMREELEQSLTGPSIGVITKEQTAGGLGGTVVGAVVGGVVGVVLAMLVPLGDWSLLPRVLLFGTVGVIAGATAGVIVGGKLGPEVRGSDQTLAGERGTTVSVHSEDTSTARRAADALDDTDAERVDSVGSSGEPRGRID